MLPPGDQLRRAAMNPSPVGIRLATPVLGQNSSNLCLELSHRKVVRHSSKALILDERTCLDKEISCSPTDLKSCKNDGFGGTRRGSMATSPKRAQYGAGLDIQCGAAYQQQHCFSISPSCDLLTTIAGTESTLPVALAFGWESLSLFAKIKAPNAGTGEGLFASHLTVQHAEAYNMYDLYVCFRSVNRGSDICRLTLRRTMLHEDDFSSKLGFGVARDLGATLRPIFGLLQRTMQFALFASRCLASSKRWLQCSQGSEQIIPVSPELSHTVATRDTLMVLGARRVRTKYGTGEESEIYDRLFADLAPVR